MEKTSLKVCYVHLHSPLLLQPPVTELFDLFHQTGYWWCHKNAHLLKNALEFEDKIFRQMILNKNSCLIIVRLFLL